MQRRPRYLRGLLVPSFKPLLSTLPLQQQAIWPLLRPTQGLGLVLYGGTAVALRCGNRESVDFDFFGPKPLDKDAMARHRVTSCRALMDEAS